MTQVIARFHLVHLVNVEQRQVVADPQIKPTALGFYVIQARSRKTVVNQ